MANRVRRHLYLFKMKLGQTCGCPALLIQKKIYDIVCRVPRKQVKSKFLYQDADIIPLADKCIVFRSIVRRNYDKVLIETGKFSDNQRVTENGLVSGVERVFKLSKSTFQNIGDRLKVSHS